LNKLFLSNNLELPLFDGHFRVRFKESKMSKSQSTNQPYSSQFREQMVELVKLGRKPKELAQEFGCHETSIRSWVRQSKQGRLGCPAPLSADERQELRAAAQAAPSSTRAGYPCKGYSLVREQERCSAHTIYALIKGNQAKHPIVAMCKTLQVSRSSYHDWQQRAPSPRAQANAILVEHIKAAHAASDASYGMPRVRKELSEQGIAAGRKRIARLMR
jgi:transposase-like protein